MIVWAPLQGRRYQGDVPSLNARRDWTERRRLARRTGPGWRVQLPVPGYAQEKVRLAASTRDSSASTPPWAASSRRVFGVPCKKRNAADRTLYLLLKKKRSDHAWQFRESLSLALKISFSEVTLAVHQLGRAFNLLRRHLERPPPRRVILDLTLAQEFGTEGRQDPVPLAQEEAVRPRLAVP
jgi:hypothetical protein